MRKVLFLFVFVMLLAQAESLAQCQVDCPEPGPVQLQWTPNDPIENVHAYRIYRRLGSENFDFNMPIAEVTNRLPAGPVVANFDDPFGVPVWTRHAYVVTAVNTVGESEPSNEVTVIKVGVPSSPTNFGIPIE